MMSLLTLMGVGLFIIPISALIDYKLFRKRVMELNGGVDPGKWYWVLPCAIESGLFMGGLILGYGASL